MKPEDDSYIIIGTCRPPGLPIDSLGIIIFGRDNSNYAYVAETDMHFRIERFRVFNYRNMEYYPVDCKLRISPKDVCPISIIFPRGDPKIFFPDDRTFISTMINSSTTSSLVKYHLSKLEKLKLSEYISIFEKLSDDLGLTDEIRGEFISSSVFGLQTKEKVWTSIEDNSESETSVDDDFKAWPDESITEWLLNRYETDDDKWYRVWVYFDEYRHPDNDLLISGLKYINYWIDDVSSVVPVGVVLRRLVEHQLDVAGSDRAMLFDAVESGFSHLRFFLRKSQVSISNRMYLFKKYTEYLLGKPDTWVYASFVRQFSTAMMGFIPRVSVEKDFSFYAPPDFEIELYLEVIIPYIESLEFNMREYQDDFFGFYLWVKQKSLSKERRRLAAVARKWGINPSNISRYYTDYDQLDHDY